MIQPDFEILYEEGPCLIVNKPSGLLTQAPPGIDSIELRIRRFLIERVQKPGKCYLGIPHRLDRPASGAMVFAKHVRAAQRISKQFEYRLVRKIYWALVEGDVQPETGTWEDYMMKVQGEARAKIVQPINPRAREAVLHYQVLGRGENVTWLQIELETGRTHQIRLQSASRGYPLLGDVQYGAMMPFGEQFEDERLRAIALHARSLSLEHPMTKEPVRVEAGVSEAWREYLNRMDAAGESGV